MYGPLLLAIIATSVLTACSLILIVSKILDSKYCEWIRLKPTEPNMMNNIGLTLKLPRKVKRYATIKERF